MNGRPVISSVACSRRGCALRAITWITTLACLLVALAWLASGWWLATFRVSGGYSFWQVDIRNGCLVLVHGRTYPPDLRLPRAHIFPIREIPGLRAREWYTAFARFTRTAPGGTIVHSTYIPLWAPCALLAIPAAWLWWRGRRRFGLGQCQSCGYHLAGLRAAACPECGVIFDNLNE